MEWQPIESFKGRRRGQWAVFYFPETENGRLTLGPHVNAEGPVYGQRRATHWMRLPKPPEA